MKKISIIIAAVLAMALTIISCSKTEELSGGKKITITTLSASIDDGANTLGTKVYITPNGLTNNGKKVTWQTGGDKLTLVNDVTKASALFSYVGADNSSSGTFDGSLDANNGDKLYVFYNDKGTVDAANISISVSYTGGTDNDRVFWDGSTNTNSATNNSLMYGGLSIPSPDIVKVKNANSIIKTTINGGTANYQHITVLAGNGELANAGTATLSWSGTAAVLSWSNLNFGGVQYAIGSVLNLSTNNVWNHLLIPTPTGPVGPLYYLFSDAELSTATSVYYVNTTSPVTLAENKSYGLVKTVAQAAIVNSGGAIDDISKAVWINQSPASDSYVFNHINEPGAPSAITLIEANTTTSVPRTYNGCVQLVTYINNISTALPASMFSGCTSLKNISFAKATAVPNFMFLGCSALEYVSFPSATTLGNDPFINCPALKTVKFYKIITDWGAYTFSGANLTNTDLYVNKNQVLGISGNSLTVGAETYVFKNIFKVL